MGNLTEISIIFRKLIIWLSLGIIVFIFLRLLFIIAINSWKASHPIRIPPPKMEFGKLPNPKFSQVATSSSGLRFTLENIEGVPVVDKPQEGTASSKVYSMPKKSPTFLSADRSNKFAVKLGFTNEPQVSNSTIYNYTDPLEPLRTLSVDSINLNFILKYRWENNPIVVSNGRLDSKDQALNEIKSFIQYNNLFDDSIALGKKNPELLTYNQLTNSFLPSTSVSTANVIKVNYFRNDLDGLKILPPAFNHSYNYVIYTRSTNTNSQVLEVSYKFWPIDFDNFGTYPIKSAISAWQDLIDGYATVVNLGNNSPQNIVIRHIYLAYYDSEDPQPYLQPIYVFEGDNDFVAFLPAVISEWLE